MSRLGSSDPLVEEFLHFLSAERGRSDNTLKAYRRDLEVFTLWLAADQSLQSVSTADIDRFIAERLTTGAAASSVARQASAIRGIYRFALEEGAMSKDPASEATIVKIGSRLPKALDQKAVGDLLDGVNGSDPIARRDRAVLELLYGTGARVSEVAGLNLSDLARQEGLLRVLGKGSRERLVPVGAGATEALSRWLAEGGRPSMVPERFARRSDADALFLNQRGQRMSRQGIDRIVASRAKRAGITSKVSPHVLRHSCATHMLAHGADIRVVQELLGHASIGTTQIYTKVTQDHLRSAYEAAHPRAPRQGTAK
ncbi:MAG: site-specific tyrosine recombinase XerD [Actinobacteria bacterium]|nr:site-specific tyrosine recombinase XerD [Actinomycetota bacterium]